MIGLPGDRALDDLPVYAAAGAELALFRPIFKIEEIAEELECTLLVEQAQADGATEISGTSCRRFIPLCQHPRRCAGVLLGRAVERSELRRFQRQAPVLVDPAESCGFFEKS